MCLPFALALTVSRHGFMCLMVTTEPRGGSSLSLTPNINASLRHCFEEVLGSATKMYRIRFGRTWWCDFGFLEAES